MMVLRLFSRTKLRTIIDRNFEEQVIFFNSYIPKHNLNNMYIFEAENTQPY